MYYPVLWCKGQEFTFIRPRRPYLVKRSRGRNQRTSSGLWNIHRTTAFILCTLTGKPVSTTFFSTTRSGSVLLRDPANEPDVRSPKNSQVLIPALLSMTSLYHMMTTRTSAGIIQTALIHCLPKYHVVCTQCGDWTKQEDISEPTL